MNDDQLNTLAHSLAFEYAVAVLESASVELADERGWFQIIDESEAIR